MINCIGNEPKNIDNLLNIPGLHFHTYGKQPMINRKLGHITLCANHKEDLAINIKKTMYYLEED